MKDLAQTIKSRRGGIQWLLQTVLSGFLLGCSVEPNTPPIPLYPLRGRVTLDGDPATGATIKFLPVNVVKQRTGDEKSTRSFRRIPAATVDQTGAFQASYFGIGDGAPVGEYKVLVFMLETPPGGGLPVDRFQGRYLNEDHPVATLTVRPGENDCGTIELGKK